LQVPMTIIATGMGIPMIDFVVRECRYAFACVVRVVSCALRVVFLVASHTGAAGQSWRVPW
jgi:hypothetical protein